MLNPAYLWQAFRLLAACAISYGAACAIGLQEGYWALITAVVVTQPALGDTVSAGRNRVTGTVIGALAGLAVIALAEFKLPPSVVFWIALAPLAILTAVRPNLRISCITLVIVVLVPTAGAPLTRPLERILEVLLGTLASLIVTAATPAPRRPPSD